MAEKRSTRMLLVGVVLIALLAAGGAAYYYYFMIPKGPAISEIKIGVIQTISGEGAIFGQESVYGFEIALDEINSGLHTGGKGGIQSLGGAKLVYSLEDAMGTVEGAKKAAESIVARYDPTIIFGCYMSRMSLGMCEILDERKVPAVVDACSDYIFQTGLKSYHAYGLPSSVGSGLVVDFVADIGKETGYTPKRVAICNEDSIFGRYAGIGIKSKCIAKEWTIVHHEEYSRYVETVAPWLIKIFEKNPDVVFYNPYFADSILIAKTNAELGFTKRVIAHVATGGCGFSDVASIQACGTAVEGYIMSGGGDATIWNLDVWKILKPLCDTFQKKYNRFPLTTVGGASKAAWMIKEALEISGKLHPDDPLSFESINDAYTKLRVGKCEGTVDEKSPLAMFQTKGWFGMGSWYGMAGNGVDISCVTPGATQVQNGVGKVIWPAIVANAKYWWPIPGSTWKKA